MPENSERDRFASAIRRDVPRRPGVYLFYDRSGRPIYIGKSVNLRERMLSYFRPNGAGLEDRTREMVFSIHDFSCCETESELLALLLEDTLIKRELPIYNIRQQEYGGYCYVRLTGDAYPTCKIAGQRDNNTGAIYGPFHDEHIAEDIVAYVNRHFRLRSCRSPEPFRKCLEFDLGTCAGPCRGRISIDEYGSMVAHAVTFLEGGGDWLEQRLEEEIAICSNSENYRRAAELKEQLGFCRRFCARQRFIHRFRTGLLSITEPGSESRSYSFDRGNLVGVTRNGAGAIGAVGIPDELLERQTDDRFLLDRANLVYVWLNGNRSASSAYGVPEQVNPDRSPAKRPIT